MKKEFSFGTIACLLLFSGCKKEDPILGEPVWIGDTLEIHAANIENVHSDIAAVKAIVRTLVGYPEEGWYQEDRIIATADFKNGSFRMNFPTSLPDEYLRVYDREGTTLSDQQAKSAIIYLTAFNADGSAVGQMFLTDEDWEVELIYC